MHMRSSKSYVIFHYRMNTEKKIVTRFAPSPTGSFHVGSARTALFNYLFARKHHGKFILRIEDTDKERSKKEYEEEIIDSLSWLGIDHDEIHRQSERTDVYKKYIQKLIDDDFAYISKEEPQEEGKRSEVIRFRNPHKKVSFKDLILGTIEFDTTDLGDFVIAKDMDTPLYNLTVVVDDFELGITHVIRGQDHISNTPRQILLLEAIGATRPLYAHIPLILASDRSKLSKRHGATSVLEYKEMGYMSEAFLNFLALIGWNPGTDEEIFSFEQLIEKFELEKVHKGSGIFNPEKLDWVNKEHLKLLTEIEIEIAIKKVLPSELKQIEGYSEEIFSKIIPIVIERISKWSDIATLVKEGELEYYFTQPSYDSAQLVWKKSTAEDAKKYLEKVIELLETMNTEDFNSLTVKDTLWSYAEEIGKGDVLWPMRVALSGKDRSPDPFMISEVLGKDETIKRIKIAIEKL
ncbi:glutamate--tRNA ligase [Candidatus Wolfebacteria bacterium]|nr:MAG: glutamate--tRNA ligase [Candidatus Wolfebacteria bacterium]